MSKTCDAGGGCKITCANGCYAMVSGGKCYKGCSRAEIDEQKVQLSAESTINLCVNEFPLGDVAAILGIEMDIPESRRTTNVSLDIKEMSVAEVIEIVRKRAVDGQDE